MLCVLWSQIVDTPVHFLRFTPTSFLLAQYISPHGNARLFPSATCWLLCASGLQPEPPLKACSRFSSSRAPGPRPSWPHPLPNSTLHHLSPEHVTPAYMRDLLSTKQINDWSEHSHELPATQVSVHPLLSRTISRLSREGISEPKHRWPHPRLS